MGNLEQPRLKVGFIPIIDCAPVVLAEELGATPPPLVLDVRAPGEWKAGHVDGSLNLPLTQLQKRLEEIPADRKVTVTCAGGYRSSIAVGLLKKSGRNDVEELAGGMAAWQTAGQPVISG